MRAEILPYQAIDFLLGRNVGVTVPPTEGFVILCPTNGATLVEKESELEGTFSGVKDRSNYPDHIAVRPAWIHYQEGLRGKVSNRKHWTPR